MLSGSPRQILAPATALLSCGMSWCRRPPLVSPHPCPLRLSVPVPPPEEDAFLLLCGQPMYSFLPCFLIELPLLFILHCLTEGILYWLFPQQKGYLTYRNAVGYTRNPITTVVKYTEYSTPCLSSSSSSTDQTDCVVACSVIC